MSNQRKVSIQDPSNSSLRDESVEVDSQEEVTEDTFAEDPESREEIEFDVMDVSDSVTDQNESVQVEDLDDDQPIWENGPTAGMIKEWKNQHGDVYITSVSFDKHIVWRTLTRLEYKQIVKKMEQLVQSGDLSSAEANMWNEETIAEICVLFPEIQRGEMSSLLAGLPSLIAQEVLEASGFIALEVRQL